MAQGRRHWLMLRARAALVALTMVGSAAATPAPGTVTLQRGTVHAADGREVPYEIGTLYVTENRAIAGSRTIAVGFARIRARVATGAPPVFWLPGGPGLSVLGALDQDDAASKARLASWLTFQDTADLVVIEQRGHTVRGERLQADTAAEPLDQPRSATADIAHAVALAKRAVAAHPDKDLAGYTIAACAQDVDDLRRALGYRTISLFGGSFGSQWSLAVMRLHPRSVARAVLSGIEPLDHGYDMPSQVLAAIQRIAAAADRDPALAAWRPAGGVMQAVHDLLERAAAAPVRVRVEVADGRPQDVVLGLADLQSALVDAAADAEAWPAFVLSLYHGHYEAWARDTLQARAAGHAALIGPLIDTSLGISAGRRAQLQADPAIAVVGEAGFAPYLAAADAWPTPDMGEALRAFVSSPIPVVLVHGDWDTSTPVENMHVQLAHFPNGRGIVVHGGGHDGAFYLLRGHPAVKQAIHAFLRDGRPGVLPDELDAPPATFAQPPFAALDATPHAGGGGGDPANGGSQTKKSP